MSGMRRWRWLRAGADVAYGVRTERTGETAFKRWTAKVFYRLITKLSDVDSRCNQSTSFRFLSLRSPNNSATRSTVRRVRAHGWFRTSVGLRLAALELMPA